jgi:hypothetical protein
MKVGLFNLFNRVGAWILLLFLVTPALIAIPVSMTPKRFLSMPSGELSLRHFQKLFSSEEWLSSFFQSGVIAVSTCVCNHSGHPMRYRLMACVIKIQRTCSRLLTLAAHHSTDHFGDGVLPPLDTAWSAGQLCGAHPCTHNSRRPDGVDHRQRIPCHH